MNNPTQTTASNSLLRAARAMRIGCILHGIAWWGVLSSGGFFLLILLDNLFKLPQALRLPLAALFGGFVLLSFYRKIYIPLLRSVSPSRAARFLETSRSIQGNVLINAYQFEKLVENKDFKDYITPIVQSSTEVLEEIRPRSIWITPSLKKWFLVLIIFALAWGALASVFPKNVMNSAARFLMPLSDVPPMGKWRIEIKPSGKISAVEGDHVDVVVKMVPLHSTAQSVPNPVIVWKDGGGTLESLSSGTSRASMQPHGKAGEFKFSFSSVNRSFVFRVWADDSCSTAVDVRVLPLPRIQEASFEIDPPEYTGLAHYLQPGPPASVNVPVGATVTSSFILSSNPREASWHERGEAKLLKKKDKHWRNTSIVNESRTYEIYSTLTQESAPRLICQGQINVIPDHPPEVDFLTEDRNLILNPGSTLSVQVKASDDYGISSLALKLARNDDTASVKIIKSWNYMGPTGQKQPPPETYKITLDPEVFVPGSVFLLTAEATDFSPQKQKSSSRPILIRVSGIQDLSVPKGDALEKFFALLKNTIAKQTYANGLTDNLATHIQEAQQAKDLARHKTAMSDAQKSAKDSGVNALEEALKREEASAFRFKLQSLVKGEMGLTQEQIGKMSDVPPEKLVTHISEIQKRQTYILNELISLLGQIANDRQEAARIKSGKNDADSTPPLVAEKLLAELKDDLKNFINDQKKIIDASKSIKDLHPEDLTDKQEALLGELAREEAQKAAFFQEKLTDFSKLPLQDFADGKVVQEINEVFQEVQAAAAELYNKKVELAIPREEAGLEKASELEQNLERWLPNTPDLIKWEMEEDSKQTDIPMAELPKQLEDIIGDLLDKEEEMQDDVEDVSSTFMDSIDKGAGWGAGDGPISNMSAKGVTGNQLPNKNEVSGRSGEGRSGKSSGQMVEDSASGKGGRETPTRLSATPFEQGSVNDQSKDTKGGATGGGKQAGSGQEGLRGPLPPPPQQKLKHLAEQQSKLRQQAESLVLQLRKQRKPTGDLESAVNAMKQMEDAAKKQNGVEVSQGYHQAMDALAAARNNYRSNKLSRIELNSLRTSNRSDTLDTQAESAPVGYEEMASAYFKSLNESSIPKK